MRPLSLSTSWNSSRHTEGADMLREIRDLGFTHVELGHGIRYSLWPGVLEALEQGVVKVSSLHNFCPVPMGVLRPSPNCYEFTDARESIRRAAVTATLETIRNAARLGASAVVLHLGSSGVTGVNRKLEKMFDRGEYLNRQYVKTKVNAVKQRQKLFPVLWARLEGCLKPIVEEAVKSNIKLGFEIRERFEEFPNEEEFETVLNAFPSEAVGYWHDFGHAARKEFVGWHDHYETLRRRAPRLVGCHIHDCRPPDEDHLPLGKGDIPYPQLLPLVPDHLIPVLELSPGVKPEDVTASQNLWNSFAKTPA